MLSNLATFVGVLLLGLAIAHVSPWLAVLFAGLVFVAVGRALASDEDTG